MRPCTRFCLILLTIGSLFLGVGCKDTETKRLSVTMEGSGSVSSDPAGIDCGQDCQHDFSSGSQVTLTAAPEDGYELESWGGACSGSGPTCQVDLTEDRAVTATFVESSNEDPCEGVSCSGHGSCKDGTCNCDEGYAGDNCSDCADGYVPSGDDCILDTASVPLEGYGTDSSFGEAAGYEICTVSNLNDSGAGSLRDCIMNRNGPAADDPTPRKVVFTVGGTITLTSDISLRQPYLTIDGFSAPSPGITVAKTGDGTDGEFRVNTWPDQLTCAHDVLVQGLRFVGVWDTRSEEHSQDAATIGIDGEEYTNCIENVVFNRITITNAQDSAGDIWGSAKHITYQYCAFINSLHPQSHSHSPGGVTDQERRYISIHHNLYAYNHERQTNIRGNVWDYNFEQNIIHAWDPYGLDGGYATQFRCREDGCPERLNLIGNYYTSSSATPAESLSQAIVFNDDASTDQVYMRGNRFPPEESDRGTAALEFARTTEAEVTLYPHNELSEKVLPKIGAPYRTPDEVRIFDEVAVEISTQRETTTVHPTEIDDILNNHGKGFTAFHGAELSLEEHPAPTVSYYRWSWAELEPVQGQYNFDLVDNAISKAKAKGLDFAFRIMPHWMSSTPSWLIDMGVGTVAVEDGSFPDHNNRNFLQYHKQLIEAFGERYDGSPDIDHIDIGSVGCWGEWNTACCGDNEATCKSYYPTDENQRTIIDWYFEAFPNIPLVMLVGGPVDYAVSKGAGWRGDCFGDYGMFSSTWNHMDHSYGPAAEDPVVGEAWKSAPVQFEVCGVMQDWYEASFDIDLILQKGLDWHMSVLNAKSSPVPSQWRPKMDEFIKKMGYRLVLTSLTHTATVKPGDSIQLNSEWKNIGVAPVYHPWPLAYRLRNSNDQVVSMWISSEDLRRWLPGSYNVEDVKTIPDSVVAGNYSLDVAILTEDETTAHVKLAIQGVRSDGWYPISSVQVED